jgi:type II secretion system protein N
MWKKTLFAFFCIVYAVVLTGTLLVVRFPKERFLSYACNVIEQHMQGFSCSIPDAAYRFPLELEFDRVRLINKDELIDLTLERVLLSFDQKDPTGRVGITFDLYGGTFKTGVILDHSSGFVELPDLELSGLKLGSVEPLQQRLARPVAGTLSVSGRYRAHREYLGKGTFAGTTRIEGLELDLRRPILQSNSVFFEEVRGETSMADGRLDIAEGLARGPKFTSSFSGEVQLARQWQESSLSVSGQLVPQEKYIKEKQQVARAVELLFKKYGTREIPYRLDGSFRDPQFYFGTTAGKIL